MSLPPKVIEEWGRVQQEVEIHERYVAALSGSRKFYNLLMAHPHAPAFWDLVEVFVINSENEHDQEGHLTAIRPRLVHWVRLANLDEAVRLGREIFGDELQQVGEITAGGPNGYKLLWRDIFVVIAIL